jgi:hypothetical protein
MRGQDDVPADLERQFTRTIRPFLETYCISCHGQQQPAAQMDLSGFTTMAALMKDGRRWSQILERLEAEEMPPKGARHPMPQERRLAVDWFHAVREHETRRNAGDPGAVLAGRLSNAEYNYTIRDLTGVDIRPAREFPVDPANTAGFDNSGETLMMSPTLLKKYLAAAREVASRTKETDSALRRIRCWSATDKFAIHQIIDFYHAHNIDYAVIFKPLRFRHRAARTARATLTGLARQHRVSAKYLEPCCPRWKAKRGWSTREAAGDVACLAPPARKMRAGCEEMRATSPGAQKVERGLSTSAGPIGTARRR